MTATETLRQLLGERGVECGWSDECNDQTWWIDSDRIYFAKGEGAQKTLMVLNLTPEQAIAATLGRGTCRMELPDLRGPAYTDVYVCSECGGEVMVGTVMGVSDVPKWCPWCGRKVEQ